MRAARPPGQQPHGSVAAQAVRLTRTALGELNDRQHTGGRTFDSFEQAVAAHESAAYQEALVGLSEGVERDFRIVEGID